MKKIFLINIILIACMAGLGSCLKAGLDDLPSYEDANITDCYFEYRYSTTRTDGGTVVNVVRMTNKTKTIDSQGNTVTMVITVPAISGTFTEAERAKVTLTNIAAYCYLSNTAKIEPLDGAPALGTIGNFTSPVKYKVTAADGKTTKTWTITTTLE